MSTIPEELQSNPLLVTTGFPRFDEIEPEHIEPAMTWLLADCTQRVEELEQNLTPTWGAIFDPLGELDIPFSYAWGPVSHLMGVKNSEELREVYEQVQPEVVKFSLRVKQSQPIYEAIKALRDSDEFENLESPQKRIIESQLLDAELAGISLAGEKRDRFNQIAKELSQLSTEFSNHVLDATKSYALLISDKADTKGMPESALQMAAASFNKVREEHQPEATTEDGPWRFTLDIPSFFPLMQHCRNRTLREEIYREYITRASFGELDNTNLIQQILRLREEKAQLLGYENFAELSLAKKMAPGVQAIEGMYDELLTASWPSAEADLADLQKLADADGIDGQLKQWDISFYAERLREKTIPI